jgi:hypothetical protein
MVTAYIYGCILVDDLKERAALPAYIPSKKNLQ